MLVKSVIKPALYHDYYIDIIHLPNNIIIRGYGKRKGGYFRIISIEIIYFSKL